MTLLHILRTPGEYTEWQPVLDVVPDLADKKVVVDCCNRRELADHAEIRTFNPVLEYPDGEPTAGAYMGGWSECRCAEGHGCTVNPGMRRTTHLREGWYQDYD